MSKYADSIRLYMSRGLVRTRDLIEAFGLTQSTVSRALRDLGDEVVRVGAGRSTQYALRHRHRGLDDLPVYRVRADGTIRRLGMLIPVCPDGFVMRQEDGLTLHSEGIPWWIFDMRPQGFLGRLYAHRHAAQLNLPESLKDWSDTHALQALLAHGHDAVGNLLLGDISRDRFVNQDIGAPIPEEEKPHTYARLAQGATNGDVAWSSAGGEQPKFSAWVSTQNGPRHVLVKFSVADENPVSERWRDLLLAEHLALETLYESGLPAVKTRVFDYKNQRFLEVERFDRVGQSGRRALMSLTALDAEFVGQGSGRWSEMTTKLARSNLITSEAERGAHLLYAYGNLIGNDDMHFGNLSFVSEHGRPYDLAPCYDMLPMAFAPRSSGMVPNHMNEISIHAGVENSTWKEAERLAYEFLQRMHQERRFSVSFQACVNLLQHRLEEASSKIAKLATS